MYKTLSVAVLLAATFAVVLGIRHADALPATGSPSPLIVARGKFTHITQSIPTTTLFTPSATGLYRLSVYTTLSTPIPSSEQDWYYVLGWTDDGGLETSNQTVYVNSSQVPPNAWGSAANAGLSPGSVSTFEAVAGSPVTYSFILSSPDNSVSSLYWAVERLE
jgi:hypothetical protein